MITYIIKATVCSILLLLVYRFLLQREKMYAFNRGYLLFSILFSLLVPLITFEVKVDTTIPESIPLPPAFAFEKTTPPQPVPATSSFSLLQAGIMVYILITTVLLFRFGRNLYRIRQTIAGNNVLQHQGARLVVIENDVPAHTFLHYIFIGKADYNNSGIRTLLLTHELSHVRQKHSWDVLFIELLLVFCWINPAWVFYKRSIQLNHELQADDAVIKTHRDIPGYQHLLLEKIQQQFSAPLASSFNYYITKQRLTMMTKAPRSKRIACLQLALLPLFLAAVFLFSERTYAQEKKTPEKKIQKEAVPDRRQVLSIGPIVTPLPPGPGASPEQLKEFNLLLDKVGSSNVQEVGDKFSKEEKQRLKALYSVISWEQRLDLPSVIFVEPPARESPTAEQLQTWIASQEYTIWVDNKHINNAELANYKPDDFALFFVDFIFKKEDYNGKYHVQIDLFTSNSYNALYKGGEDLILVSKKSQLMHALKNK